MKKRTRSQKILAVMLAMLLLICSVPICAVAAAPKITSISVEDIQLIQDTNGYFSTDYDAETCTESEEYYKYWYSPTVTVFFADGSSQEICGALEWDGEWYAVSYTDDQSAENPWGIGEHTVTVELLGVAVNFTVEIVENPVARVEVAESLPIQIIEKTNGAVYSEYDPETGEESEYFYYWYAPDLTVYFKDSTSQVISGGLDWNGNWYSVSYMDDQSAVTPWGIGEHTVTAEFLGIAVDFTVEIIESPIERIAFDETAPAKIIERAHGYMSSEYNEETDSMEEFYRYWYDIPTLTVYFKDGSSQVIFGSLEWNGTWYSVSYQDDQSAATPWGVGEHTVTAELLGVTDEFTVEIVENPVVRVELAETAPIEIIERTHGEMYSDYDSETDSIVEYFRYWCETPALTAYFKDGSSQVVRGGLEWNGIWYGVTGEDDQSAATPWGVGEHTVLLDFLGFNIEYTLEIVESPIESFSLTPDRALIQGIDNPVEYPEVLQFQMTVVVKNGYTMIASVDEIYAQTGYMPEFEYDASVSEWGVGNHTVTASFMGVTADVEIGMIENPYESISISGEHEMVITFTKPNGETVVANAISMDTRVGDYGFVGGYIETDRGVYPITFTFEPDSNNALNTKNLTAKIGDMTSNTLQNCKWVKAQEMKYNLLYDYYAIYYRGMSLQFDGTLNKTNIDGIATLATALGGFPWDDAVYEDEGYYALISAADVQQNIETYFGIANADVTMAKGYDPETDTVRISALESAFGPEVCNITYENGQWILHGYLLEDDEAPVMEICMDDAMCIQSIRMDLPSDTPVGDLNGDDKINAVDARWVLQAASGARTLTDAQKSAADLNGDGKVNAVDARWILQIASGARTL
ncbi:MAG: dockerin type I repeat-containing protein [Clostridia bacterium]|nr:dockerin type I repeat-containing protein [Clostridia bacterium]